MALSKNIKSSNSKENQLLKKIKTAVKELNDIKTGKIKAKSFDDLLN